VVRQALGGGHAGVSKRSIRVVIHWNLVTYVGTKRSRSIAW